MAGEVQYTINKARVLGGSDLRYYSYNRQELPINTKWATSFVNNTRKKYT